MSKSKNLLPSLQKLIRLASKNRNNMKSISLVIINILVVVIIVSPRGIVLR